MIKNIEFVSDTGFMCMELNGAIATGGKGFSILNLYGSMGNTPVHAIVTYTGDAAFEMQRVLQYYDGPAVSQLINMNTLKCLFCDANWEISGKAS